MNRPQPSSTVDEYIARSSGAIARTEDDRRTWWDRWWFAVCGVALIIGSDYKFRTRDPEAALSATLDTAIVLEIVVYATVAALLYIRHPRPPRIARVPVHVYLACFYVGLVVLSVSYAEYPLYTFVRAGQACTLLGLVLLATAHAHREHLHRFAHLYLVVVIGSIAYGVVTPSQPLSSTQEGRFTWLAIHPTVSGVLAGLAFVIALGYTVWGRRERPGPRWPTLGYALALVITVGAVVAIHVRGAVFAAVVAAMVLLVTVFRGSRRISILAALTTGGVVAASTASGDINEYFVRGDDPERLATLSSRTDLWEIAIDAVEARPLFGYGVGASRGIFYDDIGLGGAHNAAINVLVDLGVVGLICWSGLALALIIGVVRLRPTDDDGMTFDRALLLSIAAFLFVDGFFYEGAGAIANIASTWIFTCVAWLTVAQRDSSPVARDPTTAATP